MFGCQANYNNIYEVIFMGDLSPDEEKKILESAPKGTMTLLIIMAVLFMLGWFYLFDMFLSHGPVN